MIICTPPPYLCMKIYIYFSYVAILHEFEHCIVLKSTAIKWKQNIVDYLLLKF